MTEPQNLREAIDQLETKLDQVNAMRDALRRAIHTAKVDQSDMVEVAPLFFVQMDDAIKALRALDSKASRYLSQLGYQSTRCSMDCLAAVSDIEDCVCPCEGAGHGKWNRSTK